MEGCKGGRNGERCCILAARRGIAGTGDGALDMVPWGFLAVDEGTTVLDHVESLIRPMVRVLVLRVFMGFF